MKNKPHSQPNKVISQLMEEFAQKCKEVLNSVNVIIKVQSTMFETHKDKNSESSLTSTRVDSLSQIQAINSTIQDDTKEFKQIILNLQKQIIALQTNKTKNNSKNTNLKQCYCSRQPH